MLAWIKGLAVIDDPSVSYIITFDLATEKLIARLDRTYSFLPDWFVQDFALTQEQIPSATSSAHTAPPAAKRARTDDGTETTPTPQPQTNPASQPPPQQDPPEEFLA